MSIHIITTRKSSRADAAALCVEVECCYTVAVSAWCSAHQITGCKCTVKLLSPLFGYIYTVYMSICGHMQLYIHAI